MRIRCLLMLVALLAASPALAGQDKTQAEKFQTALGLARVKRDAGDKTSARRYFEDARRLQKFDAPLLAEYFWVLAGLDPAAALTVGREVLAMNPASQGVRDRSITESIALKDEATVVELAEEGRRREGTTALWPRRLAESFQRQNQPGRAADAYAQAVRLADSVQQDQIGLALCLEAAKRYVEAAEAWTSVPVTARQGRADLEHSRLRALALGNTPGAGEALDAWLVTTPGDREMRELAVETWVRAGQPARALALIDPLTTGPKADDWNRRKANIARSAGKPDVALAAYDRMAGRSLTAHDRTALAELLLQQGQASRAATLLHLPAPDASRCDVHNLELIDRIAGSLGTRLMVEALSPAACNAQSAWIRRGIERSVAESDHQTALKLIARLPASAAGSAAMRSLTGRLQLWTGSTSAAVQTLEAALVAAPQDVPARESLVDAYRSQQKPVEAWRVAAGFANPAGLSDERRTVLAELALEVDKPADAMRWAETLPAGDQLRGRALLASGRPEEAKAVFASIPAERLSAASALAAIDAVASTDGSAAARQAAKKFTKTGAEWRDVVARRMVLEATTGQNEEAAALRSVLVKIDAQAAVVADVEVALLTGHPDKALSIIATLPDDPQTDRVAELEAIARAGTGDVRGAIAITERLLQRKPDSIPLRIRAAELGYQQSPGAGSLSRLIELQRSYPANRSLTATTGKALASAGRTKEALALLDTVEPTGGFEYLAELRSSLRVSLASAAWAAGRHEEARTAAASAVSADPRTIAAWFVLVDAAREAGQNELDGVLRQFEVTAGNNPALVIAMAERASAFVRSSDDPLVARLASWLAEVQATDAVTVAARDMAKARVFSAAERWSESLPAVESVLAADPQSAPALKLHAELLSWSGRHAEAVAEYSRYLAVQPNDVDARRQQARVAGWGSHFAQAKRFYADLLKLYPADERVAAEAAAKMAYFDGRWDAAADAYGRWIALEPGIGEAQFERAESLRASGQIAAADKTLASLDMTSRHRLARTALDRARVNRSPAMAVIADRRDANGYQGQRLLKLQQYGGSLAASFTPSGRVTLSGQGSRVEADGGSQSLRGYRAAASGTIALTTGLSLRTAAGAWDLSSSGNRTIEGSMSASWRANQWTLGAGFDRSPILENVATVDQRLVASGPFASVAFESPRATFDLRLANQTLSDDNERRMATLSLTRVVSERLKQIRVIAWAQTLMFRSAMPAYFSPSSQVRADLGLQYTHTFFTPRFRSDRQQMFAASYLIGTDDRGTTYHHPMVNLAIEFANGLALDGRAGWIRSDVYRETSVFVGLTMRPGARVR